MQKPELSRGVNENSQARSRSETRVSSRCYDCPSARHPYLLRRSVGCRSRQPARCRKPARMGDKAKPSVLRIYRRLCCVNFREQKRHFVPPITGAQGGPDITFICWCPCSPEDASARRQSRRGLSLHSPFGGSAVFEPHLKICSPRTMKPRSPGE
jgi:hypothetical protein